MEISSLVSLEEGAVVHLRDKVTIFLFVMRLNSKRYSKAARMKSRLIYQFHALIVKGQVQKMALPLNVLNVMVLVKLESDNKSGLLYKIQFELAQGVKV